MLTATELKEIDTIDESTRYGIQGIKTLLDQLPALNESAEYTRSQIKEQEDTIKFLSDTKEYYIKAVDILYEESIGALKETLNAALRYIIYDKNYNCNLILDDKRGTKTLELTLVDLDEDFEVDLKDGAGQGIRTIISFILKAYYLINKGSRILLLDEKYSALSEHYIPRFFEFMRNMAEAKDMIIVMITHDNRFMDYADNIYMVNMGNVDKIEGLFNVEK
jgi:ABC-type dipeptide/oligopeptide/nickel transport system ATPase subunit